ncbi:hypothetical protein C7B65_07685 [Phormidesmis priestleyi ULC007]|uniref:Uncharacterized protein n=2 Tax=Phormidesmis priestleyi TaxID=268141 RepID=A0A2T1DII2_9CYAN|nr:hypothetical protein C7B65_07685 [Phormidesmis priestleyi ULC007]PZO50188.1 MAG: hypothetical protein DCF14_12315 [Phormidesmis priestleyi]
MIGNGFEVINQRFRHFQRVIFRNSSILNFLYHNELALSFCWGSGGGNISASRVSFDYIGIWLHGGVKCLLNRHRSLVIVVDNRAAEIAKDTNLPTVARDDFEQITHWIETPTPTQITLNLDAIEQWRSQFRRFKA